MRGPWQVCLSPDAVGSWEYAIRSDDPGLDGQKGAFECVPSARHGSIEPMVGYPLHFQYQDGTSMWFLGETGWRSFANDEAKHLNRQAVLHCFDLRADQGYNYIHVDLMGGGGSDGGQKVFHFLRSFEDWYADVACDRKLITALFDAVLEVSLAVCRTIPEEVGSEVDVLVASDDLGLMDRLLANVLAMYRHARQYVPSYRTGSTVGREGHG